MKDPHSLAQFIRQLVDCYYVIGVHRKPNDLCSLSRHTTTLYYFCMSFMCIYAVGMCGWDNEYF